MKAGREGKGNSTYKSESERERERERELTEIKNEGSDKNRESENSE